MSDADMIAQVEQAEAHHNNPNRGCLVCKALDTMSDEARESVLRALGGTIGQKKLAAILSQNGYPATERAVANHRREGHDQ